jgi:pyrroline-5-carboxylate reductase
MEINPLTKIAFIGAGNIATTMIAGLLRSGMPANHIWASNPTTTKLEQLAARFAIHVGTDNVQIARQADMVVLAVKPGKLAEVCRQLAPILAQRQSLVISVAAGIPLASIEAWLAGPSPIVRAMPNTASELAQGVTILCANQQVSEQQRQQIARLAQGMGIAHWVEQESTLDKLTAVSGSGPAYFFLVMEALEQAATGLGIEPAVSRRLIAQTALGAALMVQRDQQDPRLLRQQVTSPGGTTEAAINKLQAGRLIDLFQAALAAAAQRAQGIGS